MATHTRVRHERHGLGTVIVEIDGVVTVEFDTGQILKVPEDDLLSVESAEEALNNPTWASPLPVALRGLALLIRSINEQWGVFSRSRIALLPHQLWVCHRVLSRWPSRWLIADDVGLGKTIEAGLILTPLLARGKVKRLLIVAPAGLVDQWCERLRYMFDIRAARYHPEVDRPRDDFWNIHSQVVASLETLRKDHDDRWTRMKEAEPWDLVLVDEAHHLNAEETGSRTLGLRLIEELDRLDLIRGLLFFTGTPHRGKDYGFLSLLRLLDYGIDPKQPLNQVLAKLPHLMIRNNKQSVTDMRGNKLFQRVTIHDIQYSHSPAEERFYTRLTEFILTGRAYAGGLQLGTQRSVMLVLTTMQKLAASSVAAVRRALEGRLARLRSQEERRVLNQAELNDLWRKLASDKDGEGIDPDLRATLEERIDELMEAIQLNPDEIPAIEELVTLAGDVRDESRIIKLVELIYSFASDLSVLMFTEYKATQALIVSALTKRYGADKVTFINGDGALWGVLKEDGTAGTIRSDRYEAARQFNNGKVRFLVSTEAGGEGIDLQNRCYTLIHADLPWNPMRMHQRVGRLNRYGQKQAVEVFLLRNPATVEGRIWDCLEKKLERVGLAFAGAMADPEDIRLLVLGLASPAFHEKIASRAIGVNADRFDRWYDSETASFGGTDAIAAVRALIGNSASFNFASDIPGLPNVDLPDLLPFLRAALRLRGRRLEERPDGTFMFLTPEQWVAVHHTIRDRYIGHFDRSNSFPNNDKVLLGAGHRVLEAAIDDAINLSSFAASYHDLKTCIILFSCQDELSKPDAPIHRVMIGAEIVKGHTWKPITDWEILLHLNRIVERPDRPFMRADTSVAAPEALSAVADARKVVEERIPTLNLPFRKPTLRLESVLWAV